MERRRDARIETNLQLTCRVPARPRPALMHDLSHTGCRLEFEERDIGTGFTVLIEPPGAAQIPGRVVWAKGHQVGIQFDSWLEHAEAVKLGLDEPAEEAAVPADAEGLRVIVRNLRKRLRSRVA